jgi:hypothetical protein
LKQRHDSKLATPVPIAINSVIMTPSSDRGAASGLLSKTRLMLSLIVTKRLKTR